MLDAYVKGRLLRAIVSHEAPIMEAAEISYRLGGAANVAANLHALGCAVQLIGIVGNDWVGRELLALLEKSDIPSDGITIDNVSKTTLKLRVEDDSIGHLMRIDVETRLGLAKSSIALRHSCDAQIWEKDIVLVADYNKGAVDLIGASNLLKVAERKGARLIVASKRNQIEVFRGASTLILNDQELQNAANLGIDADFDEMVQKVITSTECAVLIVTLGSNGVFLRESLNNRSLIVGAHDVTLVDPTGAGDTFASVYAAAQSVAPSLTQAVNIANLAAALSVEKKGVYPVSARDLLQYIDTLQ